MLIINRDNVSPKYKLVRKGNIVFVIKNKPKYQIVKVFKNVVNL